jgi:hypothetical protein
MPVNYSESFGDDDVSCVDVHLKEKEDVKGALRKLYRRILPRGETGGNAQRSQDRKRKEY